MRDLDWSKSTVLAEWAEQECRHLDLIASWETLLSVYSALAFIGPDTDDQRLTEFKAIIAELNKFLTRMRNGLAKVTNVEDAVAFLTMHANTADMNGVRTRPTVAYNKLKQRWISQAIAVLLDAMQVSETDEGERDVD